jgi:hypothetical protein
MRWAPALAILIAAAPLGAAAGPAPWCPPSAGLAAPPPCAQRVGTLPPLPDPRPPEIAALSGPARICDLIASAADSHDLPRDFFARLIWKESRFDVKALSPAGAQGVAQFMPETARIRGLADPWDPEQAIPASAHFLADLRGRFGNLGLAAAGYNGGPDRVARWLAKGGRLPGETVDYVLSITFRPVEWFREDGREVEPRPLEKGRSFAEACRRLPVIQTRALATAAGSPWGVQVAAGISHRAALRAFRRARAQLGTVIGGRSPIVVRSRLVGGRKLYSARVGVPSRTEARRLCARIKRIGGACVVRRN